jgi:hypothetical protein
MPSVSYWELGSAIPTVVRNGFVIWAENHVGRALPITPSLKSLKSACSGRDTGDDPVDRHPNTVRAWHG